MDNFEDIILGVTNDLDIEGGDLEGPEERLLFWKALASHCVGRRHELAKELRHHHRHRSLYKSYNKTYQQQEKQAKKWLASIMDPTTEPQYRPNHLSGPRALILDSLVVEDFEPNLNALSAILKSLRPLRRVALIGYYGLEGAKAHSIRELALKRRISEAGVNQLLQKAREQIRLPQNVVALKGGDLSHGLAPEVRHTF